MSKPKTFTIFAKSVEMRLPVYNATSFNGIILKGGHSKPWVVAVNTKKGLKPFVVKLYRTIDIAARNKYHLFYPALKNSLPVEKDDCFNEFEFYLQSLSIYKYNEIFQQLKELGFTDLKEELIKEYFTLIIRNPKKFVNILKNYIKILLSFKDKGEISYLNNILCS